LVLFIYITRLASSEIFSPSNKIHREVGRAKDLSAPQHIGSWKENNDPHHKHHSVKGLQWLLSSTLGIILNSPNIWQYCPSAVLNSKVTVDVERLLVWPAYIS